MFGSPPRRGAEPAKPGAWRGFTVPDTVRVRWTKARPRRTSRRMSSSVTVGRYISTRQVRGSGSRRGLPDRTLGRKQETAFLVDIDRRHGPSRQGGQARVSGPPHAARAHGRRRRARGGRCTIHPGERDQSGAQRERFRRAPGVGSRIASGRQPGRCCVRSGDRDAGSPSPPREPPDDRCIPRERLPHLNPREARCRFGRDRARRPQRTPSRTSRSGRRWRRRAPCAPSWNRRPSL